MKKNYEKPVSELLEFGDADWTEWDDYSAFGFTQEDIPELIRLGTDRALIVGVDDDELTYAALWAPLHAWRVLAQMQATDAIFPLLDVFDWRGETDSDLISEGLSKVFQKFGQAVIEPLGMFLGEPYHDMWAYISAAEILGRIGIQHPETRDRVVEIITKALDEKFENNHDDVNGFWIADLLDLKAVESYSVIKKAFDAKKVNLRVVGDLEDVELEFGMREKRDTPAPNMPIPPDLLRVMQELDSAKKTGRDGKKAKKNKNKQKQAKKARKRNRKKK